MYYNTFEQYEKGDYSVDFEMIKYEYLNYSDCFQHIRFCSQGCNSDGEDSIYWCGDEDGEVQCPCG